MVIHYNYNHIYLKELTDPKITNQNLKKYNSVFLISFNTVLRYGWLAVQPILLSNLIYFFTD